MFRYLPDPASEFAPEVDWIHNLVTDISVFFTVAIVGTMIYFAIKYRRKGGIDHPTPHIEGNIYFEILWTALPTVISAIVAYYGYIGFDKMRNMPQGADTIEIAVEGRKWAWSFTYPNGKTTVGEFSVPVGKPIKLRITSRDVLHSFFVPGMRTKMDAVPGQYTFQWFRPVKTGPQQVFCTEYCGTNHSGMLATMNVLSEYDYEQWVTQKERIGSPADEGKKLYVQQICNSCHTLDGSRLVGPSFLNIYGRKGKFDDGTEYIVDDNYIKESILDPQKHIVEGFPRPSPMLAYQGKLSDIDIENIIAYMKSLKDAPPKVVKKAQSTENLSPLDYGKVLYKDKACFGCHSIDGSKVVGPSFKGLYKKSGEFEEGGTYVADEAYIKESILNSQKHIVKGFPKPSLMPNYEGQLGDREILALIEFIKSVQ